MIREPVPSISFPPVKERLLWLRGTIVGNNLDHKDPRTENWKGWLYQPEKRVIQAAHEKEEGGKTEERSKIAAGKLCVGQVERMAHTVFSTSYTTSMLSYIGETSYRQESNVSGCQSVQQVKEVIDTAAEYASV